MRSGRGWGTIACFLFLFGWVAVAGPLFLNGEPVDLPDPLREAPGDVYVPLLSFAPLIGVECRAEPDRVVLRWSGGRYGLSRDLLSGEGERLYVSLAWLVDQVGANVHRVGASWHVDTTPAQLVDYSIEDKRLILRFDRFAPETWREEGGVQTLRFEHCRSALSPWTLDSEDAVGEARWLPLAHSACELSLSYDGPLAIRRFETDGYYSVTLEAAASPLREDVTVLTGGLTLHERRFVGLAGPVEMDYVIAPDRRTDYRVRPMVPRSGMGTAAPLAEVAKDRAAPMAVSARSSEPFGLVVSGGVPLAAHPDTLFCLGFDAFDRLVTFEPDVTLYVAVGAARIRVDDVNRPIGDDELIAYPPDYSGHIAGTGGLPRSFRVVKLRGNAVVSAYEGVGVLPDPTATLLVATGSARERLAKLSVSDRATLTCTLGADERLLREAISIPAVLIDAGQPLPAYELTTRSLRPDAWTQPMAWSVLATDWHGGTTFLIAVRDETSAGLTLGELTTFLLGLDPPILNAVALQCGSAAVLAFYDGKAWHRDGDDAAVFVGLSLMPTAP